MAWWRSSVATLLCAASSVALLIGSPPSKLAPSRSTVVLPAKLKTGQIMADFEAAQLARLDTDRPFFQPGDTVVVACEISEGSTTRIQNYQGVCIRRKGGGMTQTFTVRKMSSGIGVERTFPLYAPSVKKIDVVRRGSVRRAKLYYLRQLTGKSARLKEKARGLAYVQRVEEERKLKREAAAAAAAEAAAAAAADGEAMDAE